MTCHRPSARHCSCNPDVGGAGEPEVLIVSVRDPQAALALRSLAAALATDVVVRAPGVLEIRGDVSALIVAMASAVPVASLAALNSPETVEDEPAPHESAERVVPLVELARRDELVARLDTEIAHQRAGTTTGVVFCDVSGGSDGAGSPGAVVLGVAAARLRAVLRRSDTLAHLGDGLFVAVVADLPVQGADEVAARTSAGIRACFDEPFSTSSGLFIVAPVVGAVIHPGPLDAVRLDGVEGTSGSDVVESGVGMTGADLVRAVERSLARRPGVLG